MSLHGTFDTLGFEELLGLLAARRASGRLSIASASTEAILLLRHGEIADAHVSRPRFATERPAPGCPRTELTHWLVEALCEILAIEKGSFAFEAEPRALDEMGMNGSSVVVDHMPTAKLLEQARERLARWRAIEPSVPSLAVVPVMATDIPGDVLVDRRTWRVLAAVARRRTVAHLAREVGMDPLDVCERLAAMMADGLVTIEGGVPQASSSEGREWLPGVREEEGRDARNDGKASAVLSF